MDSSPIEVSGSNSALTFGFEEKVHDIDVWRCTAECDPILFDEYCGFSQAQLVWGTGVGERYDLAHDGPRNEPAPIASPVAMWSQPEGADYVIHSGPTPLADGYYSVIATRYSGPCEANDDFFCLEYDYRACSYFEVRDGESQQLPRL